MSSGSRRGAAGSRQLLSRTALSSLMLLSAASFVGCDRGANGYTFVSNGGAASGGTGGAAANAGVGASAGGPVLLVPAAPPTFCTLPVTDMPVFAEHAISNRTPARRELFTWTTAEQIQEIRAGSVLMTRTERDGLGPGYAMQVLTTLAGCTACIPSQADAVALAALLSGPAFAKARYAWTEPWATRVGWPGETY
ncbi:MAG TPA: hypothetical protein VNG33_06420, partial [Polyangiaceae bacterium]|nr:hypothetical protein [Polyangiaceae bacterium]